MAATARIDRLVLDKSSGQPGSSGSLELAGSYNLDSSSYEITATGDRLRIEGLTLPGQSPLAGVLEFQANGSGTLSNPVLDFNLAAEEVSFEGQQLKAAQADGQLRDRIVRFNLAAPSFSLRANGLVGIDRPYAAEIEANIAELDLAALPPSLARSSHPGTIECTREGDGRTGHAKTGRGSSDGNRSPPEERRKGDRERGSG